MTTYKCSKCGLSIIMIKSNPIKACKSDASIIANISAIAKGQGSMKGR